MLVGIHSGCWARNSHSLATVPFVAVQQSFVISFRSAPVVSRRHPWRCSSLSLSCPVATGLTSNEALLRAAIKGLEDRTNDRMTSMKRELTQEREQADECLVNRMKLEKAPAFKRKSHA